MESISVIIQGIVTVLTAWFAYNQYTKNKMTDVEIERIKRERDERNRRRADNSAIVHGEIWRVLYTLKADRVYIVQPHPLGNESMVSVYFESLRKSVDSMKDRIQHLKINQVAVFCANMAKNLYMYFDNIDEQVNDRYAKSLLSACGTKKVAIKRLSNSNYDWVGSIFVEFTHDAEINEEEVRVVLHDCATNIQYILPEFRD